MCIGFRSLICEVLSLMDCGMNAQEFVPLPAVSQKIHFLKPVGEKWTVNSVFV